MFLMRPQLLSSPLALRHACRLTWMSALLHSRRATANAMGLDVLRTSLRDGVRITDHTSHTLPPHTTVLPVHDTNILPPCITHTFPPHTNMVPPHATKVLPPSITHTLPPHTNMVPPHATKVLPVHDAIILPPHGTQTLPPHTTNIVPPQAANILPPLTTNSVSPHDTIFGPVPLRQRVVTFNLPLMHSDPELSVVVELTSIQSPTSGCTPIRSPSPSTPIEVDRLPRMNTTDSFAPPYHGPHTLKVGLANYAPELGASSRTIRVYGPSVGAVDIGDDVPHKAVHVPLQVFHRSFHVLADSGASVSCISAVTFDVLRRRCRDVFLVPSDKLFHTNDGKQYRCMGRTVYLLHSARSPLR
jgi:hypothetical protein